MGRNPCRSGNRLRHNPYLAHKLGMGTARRSHRQRRKGHSDDRRLHYGTCGTDETLRKPVVLEEFGYPRDGQSILPRVRHSGPRRILPAYYNTIPRRFIRPERTELLGMGRRRHPGQNLHRRPGPRTARPVLRVRHRLNYHFGDKRQYPTDQITQHPPHDDSGHRCKYHRRPLSLSTCVSIVYCFHFKEALRMIAYGAYPGAFLPITI